MEIDEIDGLDDLNTSVEVIEDTNTDDVLDQNNDNTNTDTDTSADNKPVEEVLIPEGSTTSTEDDDKPTDDDIPTDIDTKNLSGIEQYLSQFNIEGGMIDFKDGSKTHFNELEADKQLDVLSKLHNSSTKAIEDKFGLDENEIGLINYMRQQEGTIDEVINNMAIQRAQTYITSQEVKDMDISKMDADAVYTSFLLKSNPEATTEQLEQDLVTAKKQSGFDNIVNNIRNRLISDRESTLNKQRQDDKSALNAEIETQRKQVVDTVSKMDSIDGLSINDGIKNDVLDLILNVNDDGDSMFMTDVFSDPEKLFKAAFWYKNGTDIISTREDYWKKEKSAAYKRGVKDAQVGRRSFSSSDVKDNKTTLHHGEPNESISFDDLYNS